MPEYVSPQNRLYRFIDSIGDGTGIININGDYSGAVTRFLTKPPSGQIFQINRILVTIRDGRGFSSDGYGAGLELTNGIRAGIGVGLSDGSIREDYLEGPPINANGDYHIWAGVDVHLSDFGNGDEYLSARWTFSKGGGIDGEPIFLDGDKGESLFIDFNDDLTGLVEHYFQVQGILNFK